MSELDLAPEDAALGVLHLGVELGAALGLLADAAERPGEGGRNADLDRACGLGLGAGPNVGRGDGCARAGENGATREAWLGVIAFRSLSAAFSHAAAGLG